MIFFPFEGAVTWPNVNSQRISSLLLSGHSSICCCRDRRVPPFAPAAQPPLCHPDSKYNSQPFSRSLCSRVFPAGVFSSSYKNLCWECYLACCFMVDSKNPVGRQLRKSQFIHLVDKVEDIVVPFGHQHFREGRSESCFKCGAVSRKSASFRTGNIPASVEHAEAKGLTRLILADQIRPELTGFFPGDGVDVLQAKRGSVKCFTDVLAEVRSKLRERWLLFRLAV